MSENTFLLFHQIIAGVEILLYGACLAAFLRPFLEPNACRKRGLGSSLEPNACRKRGLGSSLESDTRQGRDQGASLEPNACRKRGLESSLEPNTCRKRGLGSSLEPNACRKRGLGRDLRRKCFLVFLIYSAVYLVGTQLFFNGGFYMLVTVAILMASAGFLDIDRKFLLLLCTLFFCIRNLSVIIMRSADYFSSDFFLAGADTAEKAFLLAIVDCVLIDMLQFLLFSLMLWAVRRQLGGEGLKLHIRELGRLLLMPAAGILFVNLCIRFLIINDDGHIFQLYEQIPAALGLLPMVAVLLYAGILATIASFRKIIALQKERDRYLVEQQQLSAIRERMAQLEQTYDAIRRMKHEMRGHLTNIKGLAESGSYQDIDHYIARMDESMNLFQLDIHTGNAVTDVIISDKRKSAACHGVDFQTEFRYPISAGYDAYDIGIILSNLLQNALEACARQAEGKRYIFLSGRQKKRFYLIEVRNSFQGDVLFDRHTRLPVSTKKDGSENADTLSSPVHGIGLSNVKKEAEKYCGNMDIQIENQEFRVTVLLQGKDREE